MTKRTISASCAFLAFAAVMGNFFADFDIEVYRAEERARIEAIQATAEYQRDEAAQLAKWEAAR